MGSELALLVTTLGSRDDALRLARAVIEDRRAACVQILGPIASVYRWQGRVEESEEFLCLMKTPTERIDALVAFVRERHPYDTPEVTVLESRFTDQRYLAWAVEETRPGTGEVEP